MENQTDHFPLVCMLCAAEKLGCFFFLPPLSPSTTPSTESTLFFSISQQNFGQSHGVDAGCCLPVATTVLGGSFRWRKWLIFYAFQLAFPRGTAGLGLMPIFSPHPIWAPIMAINRLIIPSTQPCHDFSATCDPNVPTKAQ